MRDHLDNKTGIILGFALVAVVEILGLLLLAVAERGSGQIVIPPAYRVLLLVVSIGGMACVLLSVLFCVLQLRPMKFHFLDATFIKDIQPEATTEEVERRIASEILECTWENDDVNETKSRYATAAAIAASVSILLFAVGVVITLFIVIR